MGKVPFEKIGVNVYSLLLKESWNLYLWYFDKVVYNQCEVIQCIWAGKLLQKLAQSQCTCKIYVHWKKGTNNMESVTSQNKF